MLAAVAAIFGEHGVSIRSMEQQGFAGEARLVFVTHQASEADMAATIRALRSSMRSSGSVACSDPG